MRVVQNKFHFYPQKRINSPTEGWIAAKIVADEFEVNNRREIDCYYPNIDQTETKCNSFQILVGDHKDYEWIETFKGHLPECSFTTDAINKYNRNKARFGIGRAKIDTNTVVGKVIAGDKKMYAPYDGREHQLTTHDILVKKHC